MLFLFCGVIIISFEVIKLFFQDTPEEDFSEPNVDEHSVHNEFISDSFAHTGQGNDINIIIMWNYQVVTGVYSDQ